MPSYIMHLAEAKLIINKLKHKNNAEFVSAKWVNDFLCGILLPDAVSKNQKKYTHFWNSADEGNVVVSPDLSSFFDVHELKLLSPVEYGYLAHLHLDYCFFECYLCEAVQFLDDNNRVTEKIVEIETVYIKKTNRYVGLVDFFSEKYLYGDYTKLNHYLSDKVKPDIPEYTNRINEIAFGVGTENMKNIIKEAETFLDKDNKFDAELMVFEKEEIVDFLNKIAQEFIDCYVVEGSKIGLNTEHCG